MKVLLIEPPKIVWEMMRPCTAPPLGLAQLAGVLIQNSVNVKIIDCPALNMDWPVLEQAILSEKPDLVGVTALTPFYYEAVEVARIAKRVDPEIATVLGGPHVTFLPDETLNEDAAVDIVAHGEGEHTLVDLVRCLEHHRQLYEVKGISFRSDGKIVHTEPQPMIDVDVLPLPAYHLLPMEEYRFVVLGRYATVIASRGCPHRCSFCSEWRFWREQWRPRNPGDIGNELELLVRQYNMETIWFGDDCFNVSAELIRGICGEIKSRNLDFNWFYQGRADMVVEHRGLLPLMKETGNRMVQIGIEASTERELDSMNKRLTLDKLADAVKLLRKHDIVVQGMMIVGSRDDSADSIIHKAHYLQDLNVDWPIFTVFTPFPGSNVYQEARQNDWLEIKDYSLYDMAHTIMPTRHLTRNQVAALYRWCYATTYANPIKLFRGLITRNVWRRRVLWHMFKYTLKQMIRAVTQI